jgi:serine/threonine protein phosphatase PrpC
LPQGGSRKGAKQWQEDSFMHFTSAKAKVVVGGIFDGHGGYNGLLASTTARDTCAAFLEKNKEDCEKWDETEWSKQLKNLFEVMHTAIRDKFVNDKSASDSILKASAKRYVDDKGIVRSPNGDPVRGSVFLLFMVLCFGLVCYFFPSLLLAFLQIHGGSTGTVVVLVYNSDGSHTIITANVGDSTALLIPLKEKSKYDFLSVVCFFPHSVLRFFAFMTFFLFPFCVVLFLQDHGPENDNEFARVQKLDSNAYPYKLLFVYDKTNVFRKYECPSVFLDDGRKVRNPSLFCFCVLVLTPAFAFFFSPSSSSFF